MTTKRTYGDPCGIARALDHVGERWALLIVRDLLLGPKRFSDLRAGLPHVSPDILAGRLRELEQSGIIRRGKLPPPAASRVYELTDRGRELEPVVLALGRWGSTAQLPTGDPPLGVDSFVIGLKTLFDAGASNGLEATIELRLGEQTFRVQIKNGQLELARASADDPDATITSDVETLRAVLWHGAPSKQLQLQGDKRVAERFLTLFPRP
jgi:DNA-binding HxlR family transcriptional regulator